MRGGRLRLCRALCLPLLLLACGHTPDPGAVPPAAVGAPSPGSPLTAQRLTPGLNNLGFEPVLAAVNGWGPVEVDRSNGERAAGDGHPLTLGGKTYARGLGVHAGSDLCFSLQGTNNARCTRFTAVVGVDDEVGPRGSVQFQIYLDGEKAYDSGTLTGSGAAKTVDLDIAGKRELRLVVTDAGDGIDHDHADWAVPMISCEGGDTFFSMFMTPDPVSARDGETVTVTLNVVPQAPDDPAFSGPVSFRLRNFGPSPAFEIVEPDRLYVASALPARFPVRIRLNLGAYGVPLPDLTSVSTRLLAHYEGYEYADYTRRFPFTWNILR